MKQFIKEFIEEIEAFLKGHGGETMPELVVYRSARHFLLGSSITGLLGCLIGVGFHSITGLLGFMAGLILPTVILYLSNERDNEVILKDLKWLYETITVQLEAGLHIQQALLESEGLMKNKRLREALHKLAEQLISGEDMNRSLDAFEQSFRNHYVDSFCLILRQMQDSGYAVKLLGDIRVQMEEMERQQLSKKKEALEMQLQVFQMLLFIGILVLVMHGCILAVLQNINYL